MKATRSSEISVFTRPRRHHIAPLCKPQIPYISCVVSLRQKHLAVGLLLLPLCERWVAEPSGAPRGRGMCKQSRTNISLVIFGPFHSLFRHLIVASDITRFKIITCDSWCEVNYRGSCLGVLTLVNCCCMHRLDHLPLGNLWRISWNSPQVAAQFRSTVSVFEVRNYMTHSWHCLIIKTNCVALSSQANDTDWATATCRRNLVPTFVDRGVSHGQCGGSITVVNLSFLDRSHYFSNK
jgi:hypothetical protein